MKKFVKMIGKAVENIVFAIVSTLMFVVETIAYLAMFTLFAACIPLVWVLDLCWETQFYSTPYILVGVILFVIGNIVTKGDFYKVPDDDIPEKGTYFVLE